MYACEWDDETGGYLLVEKSSGLAGDFRPVFCEELSFLGLDRNFGWRFPQAKEPLCWAQGRRYFYRGQFVAETQGGGLFDFPVLKNVVRDLSLSPVDLHGMCCKNENLFNGQIQRTLKDIYAVFKSHKARIDLFYVAFSGGKDSLVMLDLIQRALPHDSFEVIFGDTTMELSDTYKTVAATKKFFADLSWHTARAPFDALDSWKFMGPPARKIRWCCPVHKTSPSLAKVKDILAARRGCPVADVKDFRTLAFVGVRAEESERRSTYERLSVSRKHPAQLNFYPIFDWTSAEVFLYLFAKELPFNRAYRNGLPRVGCKFCPMASQWYDCMTNHRYPAETAPYIEIVRASIKKDFDGETWREYFSDRGWQIRGSGLMLRDGAKKIAVVRDGDRYSFTITDANYSWRQWMPVLGDFVEVGANKFSLQYEGEAIVFDVDRQADGEIVSLRLPASNKKMIRLLSLVRNVLNKAAYCRNCRDCVIECPHNALTITVESVTVENCRHCYRCLEKPDGCLAVLSLEIRGGVQLPSKKLSAYRNFGLRADWLKRYLEDPITFWTSDQLGKDMFRSFDVWGKESGLFDNKHKVAANFDKLQSLGAYSLKLWGYIFVNLAYNSNVVNLFVKNVGFDEPHDNDFLLSMFENAHSATTKNNALKALKNTLCASPIGNELGQGICELKGKAVVSITRTAWENPDPLVILYSLYRFAEHADNPHSFTLTDLLDDCEREALSPKILFGSDEESLRPLLQGLVNDCPDFIRVDFNKGIQENIFLNSDKTSEDVVQLF